jgi:hypothetical protein
VLDGARAIAGYGELVQPLAVVRCRPVVIGVDHERHLVDRHPLDARQHRRSAQRQGAARRPAPKRRAATLGLDQRRDVLDLALDCRGVVERSRLGRVAAAATVVVDDRDAALREQLRQFDHVREVPEAERAADQDQRRAGAQAVVRDLRAVFRGDCVHGAVLSVRFCAG